MHTIKCFAIDDEYMALNIIKGYAEKIPFLDLCGTCKSPIKALDFLTNTKIDLLFLDIQMPDISGINFLESLKNPPMVIFTTAYQEYALNGYEYDVIDYLLKPIRFERFLKAVNKAREQLNMKNAVLNNTTVQDIAPETVEQVKDYCFLKSGYKQEKVYYNDILYVEGQKEYINIYTKEKMYTRLQSMIDILEELPNNNFIRIHKSYIVALNKISSFYGNTIEINKKSLPIGRSYKEHVKKYLTSSP